MSPRPLPYTWYWAIGGLNIIISVIMTFQGVWIPAACVAFGGIAVVALGYVERHRGAPRV
jgi:hypothetical protein